KPQLKPHRRSSLSACVGHRGIHILDVMDNSTAFNGTTTSKYLKALTNDFW
ncbi:hypothetical protein NDU88_005908, partial [Pleurodeles waltl]